MSKLGLPYVPCTLIWTKKVWTSTLLSTLPTYPKSWDILELKFALFEGVKTSGRGKIPHFWGVKSLFRFFRGGLDNFQWFQGGKAHLGAFLDFEYFYKFGHPYLIYLPQKFLAKLFFGKSMAEKFPTYLQFGHMSKISHFFSF